MSNKRFAHALVRFGLLASFLTLVFWMVWSWYAPIPSLQALWLLSYPVHLSRWWDPVFAFLGVNTFGWLWRTIFWIRREFSDGLDYSERSPTSSLLFLLVLVESFVMLAGLFLARNNGLALGLILTLTVTLGLLLLFVILLLFLCGLCYLISFFRPIGEWFIAVDK